VDDQAEREQVPLRGVLTSLNWSAEQLIARVNQVRRCRNASCLHPKSAYHWLRGTQPAPDTVADVLAALNRFTPTPLTAADLGWDARRPRRSRRALDAPYNVPVTALLHESSQGEPMHRRKFGLLTAAAVTATALDMLLPHTTSSASNGDGEAAIAPKLLDAVEQSVREARDLDDSEGSIPALLWTGGLWQNLGALLAESGHRGNQAIRLATTYIEMSETYGWILFDAGYHPQAQRVYQAGMSLAREAARHPNMDRATANLLASAAYQETWLGQFKEAETLLQVANHRAQRYPTPRLLAVLADRQITLAGARHDDAALRRAEDHAHQHLDNAAPWWSQWLSHDNIDANTGRAWLTADRVDQAEQHLARHLALGGDHHRDHALFASELAHTRLRTGDITGACTAARSALNSIGRTASPRVHTRLDTAITTLRHRYPTHPHVAALTTA
jgi:hypothetical protein